MLEKRVLSVLFDCWFLGPEIELLGIPNVCDSVHIANSSIYADISAYTYVLVQD